MRLLVTGATGFIGSRLVTLAREAGHEVVATGAVNNPVELGRKEALGRYGVDVRVGSLLDADFVRSLPRGCEGVIHLAAAQHEAHRSDEYFRRVNVEGTGQLLDAAAECGIRRFIFGSTIGVYGGIARGQLDERSATQPDNAYTRSKLQAEEAVRGRAGPMERVVVRIAETHGPGDQRLLKLFRALQRGRFLMIGPGSNFHALVHVDDVARGLLLGAIRPEAAGETFVLSGRDDITTAEMVGHVAAAVGRSVPGLKVPLGPFVLAAQASEILLRPLGVPLPLHRRSLDFFEKSFQLSIAKAAKLLAYAPQRRFSEAAGDTLDWYRTAGLL